MWLRLSNILVNRPADGTFVRRPSQRKKPFERVNSSDMEAVLGQLRHGAGPLGVPTKSAHHAAHSRHHNMVLDDGATQKSRRSSPIDLAMFAAANPDLARPASTHADPGVDVQSSAPVPAAAAAVPLRVRARVRREDVRKTMNTELTDPEMCKNNKKLFRTSYMARLRDRYHFLPGTRTPSRLTLELDPALDVLM